MPQASQKPKVESLKPTSSNAFTATSRFIRQTIHDLLPKNKWLRRALITFFITCMVVLTGMYGLARWYIWSERNTPETIGVSFIPEYAAYLGVDPKETLDALLNDLHVKHLRLTSYWDTIEATKGSYDFTQLDWEFQKAEAAHAKITLSVGLRQPRWPECHVPSWVDTTQPTTNWQPQLEAFISAVVKRYKTSPALQSYQLENEYFLKVFGICQNFSRERLVNEAALVKKLDPSHTLIISRSNNALGWPIGAPTPDEYGISIYRRVWSPLAKRYLQYPFPAWYYGFLAGWTKLATGKDSMAHELQAEPWPPHGQNIPETSLEEQSKSFNAERLKDTVEFGRATGMKTMDLWGAEYWYYRKVVLKDPSVWNEAKNIFNQ